VNMYVHLSGNTVDFAMEANPHGVFGSPYVDEFVYTEQTDVANGWLLQDGVFITPAIVPKTPEQIRTEAKAKRDADVAAIVVTTSNGKQFNGDETSQTRMARAIVAMQAANTQSVTWVLATNNATEVTLAELSEALVLAGQAQAAIWVLPK
jgi:CO/xanthine dehydrogenase FAD-binding subunit